MRYYKLPSADISKYSLMGVSPYVSVEKTFPLPYNHVSGCI